MTMVNSVIKAASLAVLIGSAAGVSAQTYPAADFKPSVVYRAPDFASHSSGSAAASGSVADPAFPASHFESKVIYLAPDWAAHSSAAAASQPARDPRYPAAYFEPQLVHPAK